jgi:RimJ/RimL family protein N-acetyltransferase
MRTPIEVPAEGLLLRPWLPTDADQVEAVTSDPSLVRWNPIAAQSASEWIANRADWTNGEHASWAAVDPAERDTVLGSVSLFKIDDYQQMAEVGYWVTPEHRGRGVATRGVQGATHFAFAELGLRRVVLFHAVDNPGSCAVATRAGFAQEGAHRQSYRYGDGEWHDEHSHARLRSDR